MAHQAGIDYVETGHALMQRIRELFAYCVQENNLETEQ